MDDSPTACVMVGIARHHARYTRAPRMTRSLVRMRKSTRVPALLRRQDKLCARTNYLCSHVACSGSIVPAILPQVIFAAIWGAAAAFLRSLPDDSRWDQDTRYNFTPFTALGVAISLFLGFRNNACYDRFLRSHISPITLPRSMALNVLRCT